MAHRGASSPFVHYALRLRPGGCGAAQGAGDGAVTKTDSGTPHLE